MKNLFFTLAFLLPVFLSSSQIPNCDLELLDINWDNEEITLTLNDNHCSNSSTPSWIPTTDSVYVMQLGFSFNGVTCLVPASGTLFTPSLGLNDTITYYFGNWNDVFNCFGSAFDYYQENCIVTVTAIGPNNSINLDAVSTNNYIGFNPVWDNCYNAVNITEQTQKDKFKVYDYQGNFLFENEIIPWKEMKGLYLIEKNNRIKKYFIN